MMTVPNVGMFCSQHGNKLFGCCILLPRPPLPGPRPLRGGELKARPEFFPTRSGELKERPEFFPTRGGEPCEAAVVTSSPPIEGEGWRSWGGVIKYEIFQRPNSFTGKIPYIKVFHDFQT